MPAVPSDRRSRYRRITGQVTGREQSDSLTDRAGPTIPAAMEAGPTIPAAMEAGPIIPAETAAGPTIPAVMAVGITIPATAAGTGDHAFEHL